MKKLLTVPCWCHRDSERRRSLPRKSGAVNGRPAAARPDLSGTWLFSIDLPPLAIKSQANGVTTMKGIDASANRAPRRRPCPARCPRQPAPVGQTGIPREGEGSVRSREQDRSGVLLRRARRSSHRPAAPHRPAAERDDLPVRGHLRRSCTGSIPTDGRPHEQGCRNPSYYGHSVGRWEGNTLVVEAVGFVEDTWFGEGGYFHSDAMHVTERFWRTARTSRIRRPSTTPGPRRAVDDAGAFDQAVHRAPRGIAALRRAGRQVSAERRSPRPAVTPERSTSRKLPFSLSSGCSRCSRSARWASGQAPPQAVPLPAGPAPPARGVPPAQDDPARIISGNDIGFRVEDVKNNRLVGRFVVRVNGQWREVEESAITKRLTQR